MPLDLPRTARQVLAELQLLMHGKTTSYNSSGGGRSENENAVPQGESNPPHEVWRRRMEKATPEKLPGLIIEARGELEAIRGYGRAAQPKPKGESRGEWEARLIREGEGFDARDVAVKFHTSVRVVTTLRANAGRDPSKGGSLVPVEASVEARRERVEQLRRGGASTRQIARLTGEAQTQVVRWTRKAA